MCALLLLGGQRHRESLDALDRREEPAEAEADRRRHVPRVANGLKEVAYQLLHEGEHVGMVVDRLHAVLAELGACLRSSDFEEAAVERVDLVPLKVADVPGLHLVEAEGPEVPRYAFGVPVVRDRLAEVVSDEVAFGVQ